MMRQFVAAIFHISVEADFVMVQTRAFDPSLPYIKRACLSLSTDR